MASGIGPSGSSIDVAQVSGGAELDVRPAVHGDRWYVALVVDGEIAALLTPRTAFFYAREIQRVALLITDPKTLQQQ